MKNTLLLLFVIVLSLRMEAQTVEASTTIPTNEYLDLLAANLVIPDSVQQKFENQDLNLTIVLTITKDGSVFNPKIQNDSLQLESNLKKAVEKLPKWNPKTENGNAVVSRKAFNLVIPIDQIIEEEPIAGKIYSKATPKDGLEKFMKQFMEEFKFDSNKVNYDIRMRLRFFVEKDGTLTNIEVVEANTPLFHSEVISVIKSTRWNPAIENGKPVRSRFTIPITIKNNR